MVGAALTGVTGGAMLERNWCPCWVKWATGRGVLAVTTAIEPANSTSTALTPASRRLLRLRRARAADPGAGNAIAQATQSRPAATKNSVLLRSWKTAAATSECGTAASLTDQSNGGQGTSSRYGVTQPGRSVPSRSSTCTTGWSRSQCVRSPQSRSMAAVASDPACSSTRSARRPALSASPAPRRSSSVPSPSAEKRGVGRRRRTRRVAVGRSTFRQPASSPAAVRATSGAWRGLWRLCSRHARRTSRAGRAAPRAAARHPRDRHRSRRPA